MTPEPSAVIESPQEQPTRRKQAWGEAGPGRPKGRANNITLQQRRIAEMVFGTPGTPEFEEFIAHERAEWKAGTMHPGIKSLWMNYLLGKPKEIVEVQGEVTVEKIVREVIDVREATDVPQRQLEEAVH